MGVQQILHTFAAKSINKAMEETKLYNQSEDQPMPLQEPVAAYACEAVAVPDDVPYAHVVDGVLQVTSDIEEEIAAVDRGETVTMDEFKTMFAKWLEN